MFCQVIEEEFPLRHLPEIGHFVVVKANHESGDEIEFFSKAWQGLKGVDSLHHAANAQKACHLPKHGYAIHVESNSRMAEQLGYVKKISGPAAKIEDASGTRQIEFCLANSSNIDSDPAVEIEVLWPVRAGIG